MGEYIMLISYRAVSECQAVADCARVNWWEWGPRVFASRGNLSLWNTDWICVQTHANDCTIADQVQKRCFWISSTVMTVLLLLYTEGNFYRPTFVVSTSVRAKLNRSTLKLANHYCGNFSKLRSEIELLEHSVFRTFRTWFVHGA